MPKPSAIFLDRDGTLIIERNYLKDPAQITLEKNVLPALKQLHLQDFLLILVTNQSGIARGFFSEEEFMATNDHLIRRLQSEGIPIAATFFCPHHPTEGHAPYQKICDCRKPEPGLLFQAQKAFDIDMASSVMIGDKPTDVQAGQRAGVTSILVQTGYGQEPYPNNLPPPDHIATDLLDAVHYIFRPKDKPSL